jgi:DNA-binding MltR family transcriptional regulator
MASKGRKKPSLSDLSQAPITHENISALFHSIKTDNDRACALVSTAALDHMLMQIILSKFIDLTPDARDSLFYNRGALSNFSSKIEISFALGLIDAREKSDLDHIRRIRNAFAHSPLSLSFSEELIAGECNKLHCFKNTSEMIEDGIGLPSDLTPAYFAQLSPKDRYIMTIHWFMLHFVKMQVSDLVLERRKLKIKGYKLKLLFWIAKINQYFSDRALSLYQTLLEIFQRQ